MNKTQDKGSAKLCYLCGKSLNKLTRDHVIPLCLFPKPRPSNLITLPCCKDCQREYQEDEEYFRNNISAISYLPTNENAKAIWQKALKSLSRGPGLREDMKSRVSAANITSPSGLYLGTATGIEIPQDRTKKVLRKIALGLFYHHTGSRVPDNFRPYVYFQPKEDFSDLLQKSARYIGDFKDTFFSAGALFDDKSSVWRMVFYKRVVAIVIFRAPRV